MFPPAKSLLKYDTPVLITKTTDRLPKRRLLTVSHQQPANFKPVPPPPKPKSDFPDRLKRDKNVTLNAIHPPRELMKGNQLRVQQVSSAPCSRADAVKLEKQLDMNLQQRRARETGICPVRRELYTQYLDELIRQTTINCAEVGLQVSRARDELQLTIDAYQRLTESSFAFGMTKALQADDGPTDLEKRISDLEKENQDLRKQLNEQKLTCDAIKQRGSDRLQVEQEKFDQEIEFLKKVNQQLQTQLEMIFTTRK